MLILKPDADRDRDRDYDVHPPKGNPQPPNPTAEELSKKTLVEKLQKPGSMQQSLNKKPVFSPFDAFHESEYGQATGPAAADDGGCCHEWADPCCYPATYPTDEGQQSRTADSSPSRHLPVAADTKAGRPTRRATAKSDLENEAVMQRPIDELFRETWDEMDVDQQQKQLAKNKEMIPHKYPSLGQEAYKYKLQNLPESAFRMPSTGYRRVPSLSTDLPPGVVPIDPLKVRVDELDGKCGTDGFDSMSSSPDVAPWPSPFRAVGTTTTKTDKETTKDDGKKRSSMKDHRQANSNESLSKSESKAPAIKAFERPIPQSRRFQDSPAGLYKASTDKWHSLRRKRALSYLSSSDSDLDEEILQLADPENMNEAERDKTKKERRVGVIAKAKAAAEMEPESKRQKANKSDAADSLLMPGDAFRMLVDAASKSTRSAQEDLGPGKGAGLSTKSSTGQTDVATSKSDTATLSSDGPSKAQADTEMQTEEQERGRKSSATQVTKDAESTNRPDDKGREPSTSRRKLRIGWDKIIQGRLSGPA